MHNREHASTLYCCMRSSKLHTANTFAKRTKHYSQNNIINNTPSYNIIMFQEMFQCHSVRKLVRNVIVYVNW